MHARAETLLITGATGFVGSHVLEAAQREGGFQLRALVRKASDAKRLESAGVEPVLGSLEDASALRTAMAGADAVLHLAAATKSRDLEGYHQANVAGTQAVVEALLAADPKPRRLIYLSSLAAVGPSDSGEPVTRHDTPKPLTAYGRTKLAGEKICEAVSGSVEVVVLRAPAVYGPRDRDVFEFFRLAKYGVLPLPGSSARRLQMIHVTDLARALLMAAASDQASGVYHVAEARSYQWRDVAGMVAEAVGRKARIFEVPGALISAAAAINETAVGILGKSTIFNREKARELLAPAWLCETELARRDFGFETRIALRDGLQQTADWYQQNGWL